MPGFVHLHVDSSYSLLARAITIARLAALAQADRAPGLALRRCEAPARWFPDRLYIDVQRHGMAAERAVEPALLDLAYERGLPLVAANEPYFPSREDYEAHDALICIAEGRLLVDTDRRQ